MIIGMIDSAKKLDIDLPHLIDTRLLIQANSGGGKSWLLRLIAERAGIQTIVLDPEGEFASLREAVDVLLVGKEGESRLTRVRRPCSSVVSSSIRFRRSSTCST